MTVTEIIKKLKGMTGSIEVPQTNFLAVQVNLTDLDPGVFYVEVKNGNISIEPYEYIDRSCAVTMKSTNFIKLIDGKLDPVVAFTMGKLKVDGDVGKALEFSKLVKKR